MKTLLFLLLGLVALPLPQNSRASETAYAAANLGHYIEIQGSINPGSSSFLLESIAEAERADAKLLIVRLDTPGGLLTSTRDIIQGISKSRVPVLVYVSPGGASATSAGALIGLAAHVTAMAPGTNLGAAHPVGQGGEDVKGAMGEKVTNDTAALARSQAALRGRSAEAADLIVTKSKSFSAEEAVKAGAADLVATDLADLIRKIDGRKITLGEAGAPHVLHTKNLTADSLVRREMRLQQRLLHFIADPNISAMLLAIGGLAIYAEISSGFAAVIPGLIGLLCILLGLVSLQALPINVGGALLFALGFVLLIAEIYITSFGFLTVAGLAALFFGGLFLIDPSASDMRVSLSILIPMVAGVGIVAATIGYMLIRESWKTKRIAADPVLDSTARVESVEAGGRAGTVLVNGEIWRFSSKSPVQIGDLCKVTQINGLSLEIERRT